MITQHFVMTSSLRIKILKINKFDDLSCDIDYDSRTDIFRLQRYIYMYTFVTDIYIYICIHKQESSFNSKDKEIFQLNLSPSRYF